MKFQIGSDPELFLRDKQQKLVRAFDVISGDKEHPIKTQNGWIQWDNVLAEFNTNPSSTVQEFIENHKLVIKDLKDYVNLSLDFSPSLKIKSNVLNDFRARTAGCSVDYNAWKSPSCERLHINQVLGYGKSNLRVAGGHLHISFEQAEQDEMFECRIKMVKALDLMLGVPSVLMDNSPASIARKKFYGKAGSFRPQTSLIHKYDGVEYRVLSNFWVQSESYMTYIFTQIQNTVENLEDVASIAMDFKDDIIKAINTGDEALATKVIKLTGISY